VAAHARHPSTGEAEAEGCEFEASQNRLKNKQNKREEVRAAWTAERGDDASSGSSPRVPTGDRSSLHLEAGGASLLCPEGTWTGRCQSPTSRTGR
jgi:hypothetical protein